VKGRQTASTHRKTIVAWLPHKAVKSCPFIQANHMISLITSSTTDPNLSSATCRTVNVMDIFNSAPRRRYGDRLYTSPIIHDNFLQTMQKPSGMHHICTKLFHYLNQNHIPCTTRVWKTTLQSEFKIIQTYSKRLDIADHSLLKPVVV
jgi:hypothetical protein